MIIKNPIDKELSITMKGIKSTIPANGLIYTENIALAKFWKDTFGFITIEENVIEPKQIDTTIVEPTVDTQLKIEDTEPEITDIIS